MSWACMKFKAEKSRSLILKRGNADEQYDVDLERKQSQLY